MEINSLFFYENQRFRPQRGPFVFISDFFEGVKVEFFRFLLNQIPYFIYLNNLLLESIKISCELIVYFSMKIKDSDLKGDPLYSFQIFSKVSKLHFFALYQNKYRISSLNSHLFNIDRNIIGNNGLFFYENQKLRTRGDPLYTTQVFSIVQKLISSLISKQIPTFVSLKNLVIDSIKIFWE